MQLKRQHIAGTFVTFLFFISITTASVNAGDLGSSPAGIYLIAYNVFSSIPTNDEMHPIGWDVNPFKSQTGAVQLNLTGAEFVPQVECASCG